MKIKAFDTGAIREDDENKVDWTVIPWEELERVARHLMNGAKKYSKDNWKKGQPTERYKRSLARHFVSVMKGETNEDHLSAVVFNALALMFNERMQIE